MTEIAKWEPPKFEGTDLLPTVAGNKLAEGEELVGEENIEGDDIVLPVLSLLHGTSDAVTRGVDGAAVGKLHLSVLDEVYDAPMRVIVIHHSKSKALFPKDNDPRFEQPHPNLPDEGPRLEECIARDGKYGDRYGNCDDCGLSRWQSKIPGEPPPVCAESHNFVVWLPTGPAMLRCSKSNYGVAKRWVSEKKMSGVNWWHHPLLLKVGQGTKVLKGGKTQTYPTLDLHWMKRDTVPADVRQQCMAMYSDIQRAMAAGRMRAEAEHDDPDIPF